MCSLTVNLKLIDILFSKNLSYKNNRRNKKRIMFKNTYEFLKFKQLNWL